MKAELVTREYWDLVDGLTAEIVIWEVPVPLRGSIHRFKYRLALIWADQCVLRYDNEAGKGDHKHVSGRQVAYEFKSVADLQADFWTDVDEWQKQNLES